MNPSIKSGVRRLLPTKPRQLASSALAVAFGPHWKSVVFGHIDRTPLAAVSQNRPFEPELKILPLLIQGPRAVFDIGANRGEYTYVFEKTTGAANTYAIEPLPRLCSQLRRLFPQVHVMNLGLSDTVGTLRLKTPIINGSPMWTRSTLEQFAEDDESGAILEEVRVTTLDLLRQQLQISDVGCIKIDVEGHEKKVLLGAAETLKTCRPALLVEIEQRHHSEPINGIFSFLEKFGYEGFFFDTSAVSLRPIANFSVETHQQRDALGSPRYANNFLFLDTAKALAMTEFANRLLK